MVACWVMGVTCNSIVVMFNFGASQRVASAVAVRLCEDLLRRMQSLHRSHQRARMAALQWIMGWLAGGAYDTMTGVKDTQSNTLHVLLNAGQAVAGILEAQDESFCALPAPALPALCMTLSPIVQHLATALVFSAAATARSCLS